ncbi:MAG: DUF808 domain-containing protein [Planctomycetaceae bacterium]|nr:DUF808 domain-containing protein [Planctomycetaceae bacterium]
MSAGLLMLLDDIASVLDNVATLTDAAIRKTSGVLGDDLALNANQVSGIRADRELPVVWSVAKGSAVNKLILIPAALLLSQFVPWLITPLLIAGGLFLCFEGAEKILHRSAGGGAKTSEHEPWTTNPPQSEELPSAAGHPVEDAGVSAGGADDSERIRGAVKTDFILSAEIVVIALGVVAGESFLSQVLSLTAIGAAMTVGVYGLVAVIVKLDDLGIWLSEKQGLRRTVGRTILAAAPRLMKLLSIAGTVAMFLVGGGILVHKIAPLHHSMELAGATLPAIPPGLIEAVANAVSGLTAGFLCVGIMHVVTGSSGAAHGSGQGRTSDT